MMRPLKRIHKLGFHKLKVHGLYFVVVIFVATTLLLLLVSQYLQLWKDLTRITDFMDIYVNVACRMFIKLLLILDETLNDPI